MINSTMDAPSGHLYQLYVNGPLHKGYNVRWRDPASNRVADDTFVHVDVDIVSGTVDLPRFSAPQIAKTMQQAQRLVDAVFNEEGTHSDELAEASELEVMLKEYRMNYRNRRAEIWEMLVDDELVELRAIGPEDSEYFATDKLIELANK